MTSLYDTVGKEVDPSDGEHQLQGKLSRQLLTPDNLHRNLSTSGRSEHGSTHYPDMDIYRRILMDNDSVSDQSDIESSADAQRHVTPSTWLENKERGVNAGQRRPPVDGNLTIANARLFDNLNERSWQNLRKSRIENEEQ